MSERLHAKLSASGAHRWMACPASISMEEGLPDQKSIYSEKGTAAHDLAAQCLLGGVNADTYLDDIVSEFTIDQKMIEVVQPYLDYVRGLSGVRFVEQKVDYSPWVPDGFGTADALILHDGTATVIDFKSGEGVKVDADENPQIMLYALGVMNEYEFLFDDVATLKLVIVQPAIDHISEWEISRADLLDWADTLLKPAAVLALSDEAPLQPGREQCRFCKAKGFCRALAEHNLSIATDGFTVVGEEPSLKDVSRLSNDEIAALIPHLDMLTSWVGGVMAHAVHVVEMGGEISGYKLVAGKTNRKWRDEAEAEVALKKKLKVVDVFTKKLISPAQAEKKLGKGHAVLTQHVIKPEGKPALAPLSDNRPALEIDPTQGFEAIGEAA